MRLQINYRKKRILQKTQMWISSLVRELRSHMPLGVAKNKRKNINTEAEQYGTKQSVGH